MNTILKVAALSALLAAPLVSFAQQNQPVTRHEVLAELAALQKVGYTPQMGYYYPQNAQRAERILSEQKAAAMSQ